MNDNNSPIIKSVPAATELRKVSGFDPLRFLRRVPSPQNGEKLWKLELPYKRLWFRLACPNGRMVVKPLRITDQLAVFEALVYAQKEDEEPLSRFTASVSTEEAPDGKYVEAAQESALNTALENAGFGVQLCDFVQSTGSSRYGSEIPASAVANAKAAAAQVKTFTAVNPTVITTAKKETSYMEPTSAEKPAPAEKPAQVTKPAPATEPIPEVVSESPITTEPEPVQPQIEEVVTDKAADYSVPVEVDQPVPSAESAAQQPSQTDTANPVQMLMDSAKAEAAIQKEPADHLQQAQSNPGYTADMTVEEICKVMTVEEAKAYVVQGGICQGWTLEKVAERRAPSLKFYVCSNTGDNVLKAAATLMIQETERRKAG